VYQYVDSRDRIGAWKAKISHWFSLGLDICDLLVVAEFVLIAALSRAIDAVFRVWCDGVR
jgi:hypothetical protein